jgi:hypothetical protein
MEDRTVVLVGSASPGFLERQERLEPLPLFIG